MEIDILGFGFLVRCKHERGPGRVLSCSWMWSIGAPSQSSHIHIGTTVELYINTEGHSAGRTTDETDNLVSAFFLIMPCFARWWVTNHCFILTLLFIEGMMFIVAIVFWLLLFFNHICWWRFLLSVEITTTECGALLLTMVCEPKRAVLREWGINFDLTVRAAAATDEVCSDWNVPACQCSCCKKGRADWQCCHWSWHDRRAGEEVSCLMTVVMPNRKRLLRSSNGSSLWHPRPHSWRDEKCWNTVKLLSTVDFFQWCQPMGH